ncbi:MAG: dipeptide ABC transporter ATP-binding protein [Acidimicrobiales bacterium]
MSKPAHPDRPLPQDVTRYDTAAAGQNRGDGNRPDRPAERRRSNNIWRGLLHNRKAMVGSILLLLFLVLAIFPGRIAPYNPSAETFAPNLSPSGIHWLGTTSFGQDIFSQLIWGARQSLIIAFAAGGIATCVAVLVGVAAAYIGGFTDGVLSTLTDILLVIPIFPLFIVIAAYLRSAGLVDIIIILGALNWSYSARQLRVQALSMRNRDFLKAAGVRGERTRYIIAAEMLPSMSSIIVAAFCLNAVFAVLTAAGLQFIGLGDPNAQSWGTMLYWAYQQAALQSGLALWAIMPGVCIALFGGSLALMNFAFDEISNPALRPVRRISRQRLAQSGLGPAQVRDAVAPDGRERPATALPSHGVSWRPREPDVARATDGVATSSSSRLLEVRNLSVAYATDDGPVVAVDGVDLDLDRGEFLAIVGEAGCGKSTLVFAISRLLSPPAGIIGGSVAFCGQEMAEMSDKQLRHIRWRDFSVVMQSAMNALNPVMTVGQQMRDACKAHSAMTNEEIAKRSAEVLRLVSIDPLHLGSYPHQLSGGMRQRAMIAMSLLFTPDLVVMDEPTSALDVVGQRSLMRQVKELQDRLGFAVIFVTHDISLVSHYADRLMVMYAGQVAELGATSTLFETPRHPYARALLEAYPSIRGERVALTGIAGSPPNLLSPPRGCRFQPRCADAMPECTVVDPPIYRVGGSDVRCLLYRQAEAGTGSLAGRTAREAGDGAAVVGAGLQTVSPPEPLPQTSGAPASAPLPVGDGQPELPLLEVSGLSRNFGLRGFRSKRLLHAVDDVSFTIGRREIVALVGESGSGKSTIAQLLALVYRPTSGEVRFDGKPIGTIKGRRAKLAYRGEVPMVFQDPYTAINPSYRVSHAIRRAIKLHRRDLDASTQRSEVTRVMEAVGLEPAEAMLAKYPYELSGGQRQRIGFAQALVLRPKLILADEPVSMLDVSIRVGVLNLMAELRKREGVSILYITHDLASARYIADRIIVLYAGHVVEVGPTEQLLAGPRHPYTKLLLSAVPDPRRPLDESATADAGEPPRVVDPLPGCRFQPRCPYAIEECKTVTPQLGEVAPSQLAACHVALAEARRTSLVPA